MKSSNFPKLLQRQQGGTLLEAMIAIVIFSFGILGLIGLQANMTSAASDAKYRAEAGFIAQQRIAEIWLANPLNLSDYQELPPTDIASSSGLPGGRRTTIRGGPDCDNNLQCFTVIVEWQQPSSDEVHRVTMIANVTP